MPWAWAASGVLPRVATAKKSKGHRQHSALAQHEPITAPAAAETTTITRTWQHPPYGPLAPATANGAEHWHGDHNQPAQPAFLLAVTEEEPNNSGLSARQEHVGHRAAGPTTPTRIEGPTRSGSQPRPVASVAPLASVGPSDVRADQSQLTHRTCSQGHR